MHAVMRGGESSVTRCAWSRRTSEVQGRHREVGSAGRAECVCGAKDTNPIRSGGTVGTGGHATVKSAFRRRTVLDELGACARKV